jgi:hypothetical protein
MRVKNSDGYRGLAKQSIGGYGTDKEANENPRFILILVFVLLSRPSILFLQIGNEKERWKEKNARQESLLPRVIFSL